MAQRYSHSYAELGNWAGVIQIRVHSGAIEIVHKPPQDPKAAVAQIKQYINGKGLQQKVLVVPPYSPMQAQPKIPVRGLYRCLSDISLYLREDADEVFPPRVQVFHYLATSVAQSAGSLIILQWPLLPTRKIWRQHRGEPAGWHFAHCDRSTTQSNELTIAATDIIQDIKSRYNLLFHLQMSIVPTTPAGLQGANKNKEKGKGKGSSASGEEKGKKGKGKIRCSPPKSLVAKVIGENAINNSTTSKPIPKGPPSPTGAGACASASTGSQNYIAPLEATASGNGSPMVLDAQIDVEPAPP